MTVQWFRIVFPVNGLLLASMLVVAGGQGVRAEAADFVADETDKALLDKPSISSVANIPHVGDRNRPATTVKDWLAQIEATTVQVTSVKVEVRSEPQGERTDTELEIILKTADGKPLQIDASKFRQAGNSLIANIPSAVLALPNAQEFTADNPTSDIARVQVTQQDATNLRVSVVGTTALPKTEVILKTGGLAYSLNPEVEEPEEEIVVTGQGEGSYFVPDATTATKTDTPIRDIPFSIQVVPRQVLEDRNATELRDALETVGGISSAGARGTSGGGENFNIRGFDILATPMIPAVLRDGIPFFSLGTLDTNDIERIEVLKGSASVLFGPGQPGGVINLVSKQPLAEPFYAASFTAGSFNTYRGAIDFSGPLNEAKTIRYRFNASYENYGSFRDFVNGERWSISSTIAADLTPNTTLSVYGQFIQERETIDEGLPETMNGVIDLPRSRFLGEPFSQFSQDQFNIGYTLKHQFSDNWFTRHALQYLQYKPLRFYPTFGFGSGFIDEATGELGRVTELSDGTYSRFFTNAEVVGKFRTGSVQHGCDLYLI